MGISDIHVFPITITCLLQGTLCDTGIPCTFYGENICSAMYGTRQKCTKHSTVDWDSTDWQPGLTVVQFCLNSFHLHSQNVSFKNQVGRK